MSLKKRKVVILPSKESKLFLSDDKNSISTMPVLTKSANAINLYIISDEEIKEEDNVIVGNRIVKAIKNCGTICYESFNEVALLYFKPHHKKIIATTDTSLAFTAGQKHWRQLPPKERIPQIPASFISLFIKEYNKGNVIKKVKVEYEDDIQCTYRYNQAGFKVGLPRNKKVGIKLKFNFNNIINIKMVETEEELIYFPFKVNKDSITLYNAGKFGEESLTLDKTKCALLFIELWRFLGINTPNTEMVKDVIYTKEKVELLLRDMYKFGWNGGYEEGYGKFESKIHDCNSVNKWIEENL